MILLLLREYNDFPLALDCQVFAAKGRADFYIFVVLGSILAELICASLSGNDLLMAGAC